ncbi:Exportin-2 [Araneus ventricosus]|uniref:Exportin-2 n=1 Tax=Araneus ventricosus TaxID=182803 RepID=A0A4Y2LBC8_ARAVE|nr:Exportin-2 [Araneus ventricosus]
MEVTENNLQTLVGYLQHTLSPDPTVRRPAEKFLESVEANQNYPVLLLTLVDKADVDMTIRVAGAVTFKNYVKRNWRIISLLSCLYMVHVKSDHVQTSYVAAVWNASSDVIFAI